MLYVVNEASSTSTLISPEPSSLEKNEERISVEFNKAIQPYTVTLQNMLHELEVSAIIFLNSKYKFPDQGSQLNKSGMKKPSVQ